MNSFIALKLKLFIFTYECIIYPCLMHVELYVHPAHRTRQENRNIHQRHHLQIN